MRNSTSSSGPANEGGGGALRVAAGILASRTSGFVRDAALAYFFGAGAHADVFRTALRGPNALQNLLGEQTLSASFIPVYSRMLAAGERERAGRFAGAVFALLLIAAAGLALVGVLAARPLVALFAPGYLGDAAAVAAGEMRVDRFALSVRAVRWIFPMTGLLVLSAWCLGVLNSHRRFFLSYVAPVAWNAAIVAALVGAAGGLAVPAEVALLDRLLIAACVGALVGGGLQLAVQLPPVARLLQGFRFRPSLAVPGVREALGAFGPLVAGRGVVQLSGYVDLVLASLLAAGAVGGLGYAQTLYLLPVSLFGMSVAAAELPELARASRPEGRAEMVRRTGLAWRRVTFLTVPTTVGYLAFGFLVVGLLYRRGSFGAEDNWLVWVVLCGYAVGLPATNSSRLLNNVFFSLLETRTPAWIAARRVAVSALLGAGLMLWLDRFAVADLFPVTAAAGRPALRLGALGLSAAAGVAAWLELALLVAALRRRVEAFRLPFARAVPMVAVALVALLPAAAAWWGLAGSPAWLAAPPVVGLYAAAYLLLSRAFGIDEADPWLRRVLPARGGDGDGERGGDA